MKNDSNTLLSRRGYADFADAVKRLDADADAQAKKWIESGEKVGLFGAIRRSIAAFRHSYYREGYKCEGVPGLFLSVNDGMLPFLAYAKYWEIKTGAGRKGVPA